MPHPSVYVRFGGIAAAILASLAAGFIAAFYASGKLSPPGWEKTTFVLAWLLTVAGAGYGFARTSSWRRVLLAGLVVAVALGLAPRTKCNPQQVAVGQC